MMLSSSFALLVCMCSVIDTRAIEGDSNYVADNFIDAVTQKAGQNDDGEDDGVSNVANDLEDMLGEEAGHDDLKKEVDDPKEWDPCKLTPYEKFIGLEIDWCHDINYDYPGHDLWKRPYPAVSTALQCQKACASIRGCKFFTFKTNHACWLKTSNEGKLVDRLSMGTISGPACCGRWTGGSNIGTWETWDQLSDKVISNSDLSF